MVAVLRALPVIAVVALLSCSAPASADVIENLKKLVTRDAMEDRDWIEVTTPNFRIRSALSEKETINLARHVEDVKAIFEVTIGIGIEDATVPLEIVILRNSGEFKQLVNSPRKGGMFLPGLRKNTIVVHDTNGYIPTTELLAREYAYYILGDQRKVNFPLWFKDGFGLVFSTVREKSGRLLIGDPPEVSAMYLGRWDWIPLGLFLNRQLYDQSSMRPASFFYAEAWAVVHYLYHRPERDTLNADIARYIELLDAGQDDVESFESAFNMKTKSLDRQIRTSIGMNDFSYIFAADNTLDELVPDFEPQVDSLSREQISLTLGHIALSQRNLDAAHHWFNVATEDKATLAQAAAGLGDVYELDGQPRVAESHFETAVKLAPDDPYCQLDIGKHFHGRARRAKSAEDRAAFLARARKHYVEAWKLEDSRPEPYILYGQTFLTEGENYAKAIEMLEFAEAMLPANLTVRAMLAKAYQGAGRIDDAREAARSVQAWSHEDSNAAWVAREILADLRP